MNNKAISIKIDTQLPSYPILNLLQILSFNAITNGLTKICFERTVSLLGMQHFPPTHMSHCYGQQVNAVVFSRGRNLL